MDQERFILVKAWFKDIADKYKANDGWTYVTKAIVFSVAAVGAIIALTNYRTNAISTHRSDTNSAFLRAQTLLFSSDSYERLVGLRDFSEFFSLEIPMSIKDQDFLHLSFLPERRSRAYLGDSRDTFILYFEKAFSKSNELDGSVDGISSKQKDSRDAFVAYGARETEFKKLTDLLANLGCGGWSKGIENPLPDNAARLQWLWVSSSNLASVISDVYPDTKRTCSNQVLDDHLMVQDRSENILQSVDILTYCANEIIEKDSRVREIFNQKNLSNLSFRNQYLVGSEFAESYLAFTDFSNSIINAANFHDSDITNAKFTRSRLVDANFADTDGVGVEFTESDLCGATFDNAHLPKLVLRGPAIVGTQGYAVISPPVGINKLLADSISFRRARLPSSQFSNAALSNSSMAQSDMTGSSFVQVVARYATLTDAVLARSDVFCVDFANVDARRTDYRDANINLVSFRESNLVGAKFGGAIISNASFEGADLSGVDFTDSQIEYSTVSFAGSRNLGLAKGLRKTDSIEIANNGKQDAFIRSRCRFQNY